MTDLQTPNAALLAEAEQHQWAIRAGMPPGEQFAYCVACKAQWPCLTSRLAVALREAAKDSERLEWLEREMQREQEELLDGGTVVTHSLFRQNRPITRAAIDAALAGGRPVPPAKEQHQ